MTDLRTVLGSEGNGRLLRREYKRSLDPWDACGGVEYDIMSRKGDGICYFGERGRRGVGN